MFASSIDRRVQFTETAKKYFTVFLNPRNLLEFLVIIIWCYNNSIFILYVNSQYPIPESHILKSSRIGKAVMLLFRHPKETRKNKEKAGKLISE